jgi:hypothetical protein
MTLLFFAHDAAIHPFSCTVGVMLTLPDGQTGFYLVDNVAGCIECSTAMGGRNTDQYGRLGQCQ